MDGKLGPLDVDVHVDDKTNQSSITPREVNSNFIGRSLQYCISKKVSN
jgi:hypothetical protein